MEEGMERRRDTGTARYRAKKKKKTKKNELGKGSRASDKSMDGTAGGARRRCECDSKGRDGRGRRGRRGEEEGWPETDSMDR